MSPKALKEKKRKKEKKKKVTWEFDGHFLPIVLPFVAIPKR